MAEIYFLTHTLGAVRVGGTERAVAMLANQLSRWHTITVVSMMPEREAYFNLDENVSVDCLSLRHCDTSGLSAIGKVGWILLCALRLLRFVRRCSDDAIFVAHSARLGFVISLISLIVKRRFFVCEHQSHAVSMSLMYRDLRIRLYRGLAGIICLNEDDRRFFIRNGVRAFTLHNGVADSFLDASSGHFQKTVVYVGRCDENKNVLALVKIMLTTGLFSEGYRLSLTGGGPEVGRILDFIRKEGLQEAVEVHPFARDVISAYQRGSIFALTSRSEGFGLCLIEAMALGLPCVAFDVPSGPREIIRHGVNGYLIRVDDEFEFAAAIRNIESDYECFADAAKRTASSFSAETTGRKWSETLTAGMV